MVLKLTKDEFIEKAKEKHGEKYDYSLVDYKGSHYKIKIICPDHGEFEQVAREHLKNKCGKCRTKNPQDFINEANLLHNNKYDYSQINYTNNNTKVSIICPYHGEFLQAPHAHLRPQGCRKCHSAKVSLTNEEFIKRSKITHGDLYDYSLTKYIMSHKKVIIICKIHGKFEQFPYDHSTGVGCPKCKCSHGEKLFRDYFIENKINFVEQIKFETCKNIRQLPFDFYLVDKNVLIEYQGEHHFSPKSKGRMYGASDPYGEYLKIKYNDQIKLDWCLDNNIKLVAIHYKDKRPINKILEDYIN